MILNDLLGCRAVDDSGTRLGRVIDARFVLTGHRSPATATMIGLIVSPRSAASFLGYERTAASRPVIIDRLLRIMHRGSFLVPWEDVARIESGRVVLRPEYRRLPSQLD